MPKIVEIVGVSGVGKTSLYKLLQEKWLIRENWGVYHDIRYKRKAKRTFPGDYLDIIKRYIQSNKPDIQYEDFNELRVPNERLFFDEYPEFCNTVIELINKHNKIMYSGCDHRYINTYFFFETIEHYQAISQKKRDDRVCIMDEGFLSRLMHLSSPSFNKEDIGKYLISMPNPDAVVYLECDVDQVVNRIQKRDRLATLHKNLTPRQLYHSTKKTAELMETAVKELQNDGVMIKKIDANNDIISVRDQVLEFVKKIDNRQ